MRLLFDKNNVGEDELKELLGYVDADLRFKNLRPDIVTATNDVVTLIGREIYAEAEKIYYAAETTDQDLLILHRSFLHTITYPIAVNAYRLYAPTNDLSHTNNGRKMRSDSEEKSPFEWMIDRDNAAQEKRYYRALDDLILFLDNLTPHVLPPYEGDEQPPTLTSAQAFENILYAIWITSAAYIATHNLFIRTVTDFDNCFPLNSRLLLTRLSNGLADCEMYEILPRIGAIRFTQLKAMVVARVEMTIEDRLLVSLIRKATAYYALAWAIPRFSVNLFPEGVLQHYTSDRATTRGAKPSIKLEPEAARMAFKSDADRALLEIERLLTPAPVIDTDCDDVRVRGCSDDKFFSAT